MDAPRAAGVSLTIDIGGEQRSFARLSMRQVASLLSEIPIKDEANRPFLSVFDLTRWAATPDGCVAVLAVASGEDRGAVGKWGSAVQRATAAGIVAAESVLTGDEPPKKSGNAEGEHRRPPSQSTTRKKRTA